MDRGTPSMGMTRREWLKYTTIAGAAATVGGRAAYGAICGDSPVPISSVARYGLWHTRRDAAQPAGPRTVETEHAGAAGDATGLAQA